MVKPTSEIIRNKIKNIKIAKSTVPKATPATAAPALVYFSGLVSISFRAANPLCTATIANTNESIIPTIGIKRTKYVARPNHKLSRAFLLGCSTVPPSVLAVVTDAFLSFSTFFVLAGINRGVTINLGKSSSVL